MIAGILLLLNAHGAYIMQPLPDMPHTVCLATARSTTAHCWRATTRIRGTHGRKAQQFTIKINRHDRRHQR